MKLFSKRPLHRTVTESGYLLPVVIALAIGISTVSAFALQSVAWNSSTLNNQYYESLAREAAKAGITAAVSCINSGTVTWSDSTPLRPDTNCAGIGQASQQPTVYSDGTIESTYEVKALQNPYNNTTRVIQADAKASIKGPSGIEAKTFPATVKALVNIPPTSNAADTDTISVGSESACTLAEGWVYCWGSNANGRLGTGLSLTYNRSLVPVAVASGPIPAQPALPKIPNPCGGLFQPACVFGGLPAAAAQAANPMSGKTVTKISVGDAHACAIADGKAYCWGANDSGQLGNRTTIDSAVPVEVDTMATDYTPPPVVPSPCGGWFQPSCTPVPQPTQSKSDIAGKTIVDISAGPNFTCALTSEGNVACWGANDSGQLGTNNTTNYPYPKAVYKSDFVPGTPAVMGPPSPCGGWFQPSCSTQVVITPAVPDAPPTALWGKQVKKLARVKGGTTMCATDTNDKAYCWGENSRGQIGDKPHSISGSISKTGKCEGGATDYPDATVPEPDFPDALQPVAVQLTQPVDILTTFPTHVTAKTTSAASNPNRVYMWSVVSGSVSNVTKSRKVCGSTGGQSGAGVNKWEGTTKYNYTLTTSVPSAPLYDDATGTTLNKKQLGVVAGDAYNNLFCATTGSDVYCDTNGKSANEGQTGNGTVVTCSTNWLGQKTCSPTIPTNAPQSVKVSGVLAGQLPIVDMDSSSTGFTCALASKKVFCWGVNGSGQLGNNTTTNAFEPVAAPLPAGVGSGNEAGGTVTSIFYF